MPYESTNKKAKRKPIRPIRLALLGCLIVLLGASTALAQPNRPIPQPQPSPQPQPRPSNPDGPNQPNNPGRIQIPRAQPNTPQPEAQAQPQDAAPDWVVPGARITLYGENGVTLKQNDPENPRIPVAGSGYQQFDVIAVTPEGVLMEVRYYSIPLNETRPQLSDFQLKIFDAASGGQLWVPASERANVPVTTDPNANPRIELGPYELNGDTYDAIHFVKTEQNDGEVTIRRVYDQRTGIILYQSEQKDNADGKVIVWSQYHGYRVAELPWQNTTLTERVRGLDRLVYESVVTQRTQGFPDQSRTTELNFTLGQSTERLIDVAVTAHRHVPRGAPPMTDEAQTPVAQKIGTSQRLGLFIHPDVLSQLERGQVLDEDPIIGYQIAVTDVYQVEGVTMVEITEQGPGNSYISSNTYDARVGLAVAGEQTLPGMDITIENTLIRVE